MIKLLMICGIGISLVGCAAEPYSTSYHEQVTYTYPATAYYYPSVRVYSGYTAPYYVNRSYVNRSYVNNERIVNQVYVSPRSFAPHDDGSEHRRGDGDRREGYRTDDHRRDEYRVDPRRVDGYRRDGDRPSGYRVDAQSAAHFKPPMNDPRPAWASHDMRTRVPQPNAVKPVVPQGVGHHGNDDHQHEFGDRH